jgi:ferredoxin
MSLMITDECINCDVCEPECPTRRSTRDRDLSHRPDRCTNASGIDQPQCQAFPVDCIPLDPERRETREGCW